MSRIVPSQVVEFIDRVFPGTGIGNLGRGNSGQLSALAELVRKVPEELLMMDSEAYAGFICGVAHIREKLVGWANDRSTRSDLDPVAGFGGDSAVTLIREALSLCPDEALAPSTSELSFISDPDLRTNLRIDIGVIYRALSNGEWKATTVLAGSAVEALLLWRLRQFPSADIDAVVSGLMASGGLSRQPNRLLEWWNLSDYIEVAEKIKIILKDTATQARLAKNFRNFIHPGREFRLSQKCDKGTAFSAVAGMELIIRDLM